MVNIVDLLSQVQGTQKLAQQLEGKLDSINIAPVWDVDEQDRVRVLLPHTGGRSLSPPMHRMLPTGALTYPALKRGDTVVFGFINGNPTQGIVLGTIHNDPNPPDALDRTTYRLGESKWVITEDMLSQSQGDEETYSKVEVNPDLVLVERSGTMGSKIEVTDGAIILTVGTVQYVFSQYGIQISNGTFRLLGITDASINNKQITTLGAKDSDNDTLVTKGW